MKSRKLRVVLTFVVLALALFACVPGSGETLSGDADGEAVEQPAEMDGEAADGPAADEPASDEPEMQSDEEGDTGEEAMVADEDEPEAEMAFTVTGTVYYDVNEDSRFAEAGPDALYEGATVTLVDAETGDVIDTQTTGSDGRYRFDLPEVRDDVAVVVSTEEDLVFGPPVEASPDVLPSGVDAGGRSMPLIVSLERSEVVNAALQNPQVSGGAVLTTTFDTIDLHAIACATGESVETAGRPWAVSTYTLTGGTRAITVAFSADALSGDELTFIGIDVKGDGLPLAPQNPDLALTPATYAASVAILDGVGQGTAALTALDGATVNTSAAIEVEAVDGQILVSFLASNFRGGLTDFRLTISDGEVCLLSGPLDEDGGYRAAGEFDPGLEDLFATADSVPFFDTRNGTGLLVPEELNPQRTGDATFDITLGDATVGAQVDVLSGTSADRIGQFSEIYVLEPGPDIETSLLTFETFTLLFDGQPYGGAGFADNGSAATPVAFTISLVDDAPLTEEQMATLFAVLSQLAETFRSQFQLVD